jgi:hypothetical protein
VKHAPHLLGAALLMLTTGCATLRDYHAPPNAHVAKLNLKSMGSKWICVAGERQRLMADSTGYADIPSGKPLTIGVNYYNYVYGGVSTSCNPRSTLVPTAGQRYFIDFEIEAERCAALIFREDPKTRTGLAFDLTLNQTSPECPGR